MPVKGHPPTALVRFSPEDFERLRSVARPGESRAATLLRLLQEADLPPSVIVRYRKPPAFATWLSVGPLSPIVADNRVQALTRAGFTVEVLDAADPALVPASAAVLRS